MYEVNISAETPNMIDISQAKVESGRYINDTDYQQESMVCFIGHDIADEFFPSLDPIVALRYE